MLGMETTLTPFLRSMALKATACSRLRVNRENFQTRISWKGALGRLASSSILRNWGRRCDHSQPRPRTPVPRGSRSSRHSLGAP